MTNRPGRRALWVLLASGLLGFRAGIVGFPNWHVAVETAQVLAGLVEYPAGNPFYIYHTTVWTLLNQACAVLLSMGVSEIALSMFLSGVLGMVSFQALSLFVYALSAKPWLSVGAAVVLFVSRAAEYGVTYPIILVGTSDTYGILGLSTFVLVVALLGCGWFRVAALLLGLAPAIHPSLGLWLWVTVGLGILWDVRGFWTELRPSTKYFVAGVALTAASLLVQLSYIYDAPDVDPAISTAYFNAFIRYFDGHRQPVRMVSAAVVFNGAALVLALVWLVGFRRELARSRVLLLAIVAAGAVLSLSFVVLSRVPPEQLPHALLIFMPTRLLNFNTMCFVPFLFGMLATLRIGFWSHALTAALTAGLLLSGRSMLWEWVEQRAPVWHSPLGQLLLIGGVTIAVLGFAIAELMRLRRADRGPTESAGTQASRLVIRGAQFVTASVCVAAVLLTWRIRSDVRLLDRTNDAFMAEVAANRTGLTATAGSFRLIQLRTRRPVLLDGGSLNILSYAPKGGPAMNRILRDVYAIDLFDPPPAVPRGAGILPHEAHRARWEGFSPEAWQQIRRVHNVTQVLTQPRWELNLPVVAQDSSFKLYRIPPLTSESRVQPPFLQLPGTP
jgi:hypothetical protein